MENLKMKRIAIVIAASLSLVGAAHATDYSQCNIEVIQKKDSFNVAIVAATVLEKLGKSDNWKAAFAGQQGAPSALMLEAVQMIEAVTEVPTGGYVQRIAAFQADKVSEAMQSTQLSVKIAAKGDPKLAPLLILGAGFESGKAIGDSIAIIASAPLSSCNKAD
jgi:hypothetical protein